MSQKNILGLDLGTTSIGFAQIIEGDTPEQSEIIQIGSRIIQYNNFSKVDKNGRVSESKKPEEDFAAGKGLSPNADRTLKRGARRTLDRYQLRRDNLIDALIKANIITKDTVLAEDGKQTTHETWRLRAKAVTEKIEKEELARVFLAINKKRGYKSSRKAKNEDGIAIDDRATAQKLSKDNITPGQFVYTQLLNGEKVVKVFYRTQLQKEFDKIWEKQKQYYPNILTAKLKEELHNKNKSQTWAICQKPFEIVGVKRKEKKVEQNIENYKWRTIALNEKLELEYLAIVLQEINAQIKNTSGLLSEISDRSLDLYLNNETVGQNQYNQLLKNPHTKLKNQVFYRQDYLDEFEAIWTEQSKHHIELTAELKDEIRDIIIFYQRKLKSQKGLVSYCEFEHTLKEFNHNNIFIGNSPLINYKSKSIKALNKNGLKIRIEEKFSNSFFEKYSKDDKISTKEFKEALNLDISEGLYYKSGQKVAPKSSLLFQEFKIWQVLHTLKFVNKETGEIQVFKEDDFIEVKQLLFNELNLKGNLSATQVLNILDYNSKEWSLSNYKVVEGNRTNLALYDSYFKILEIEGFGEIDWEGYKSVKEDSPKTIFDYFQFTKSAEDFIEGSKKTFDKYSSIELKRILKNIFKHLNINTDILEFNAELDGKAFEQQKSYQLWHLLYSYEGDDSASGNEKLYELLQQKFGFKKEHAQILANVTFQDDYGNLSTKAMRKIYPYIKENQYSTACELAGYRHSASSLTKEEIANRPLKDKLELLKKNSLRNPVVEKILNQLVNVVNALLEKNRKTNPDFRFDEIRIELSRELKKNAKERAEMTTNINAAKTENDKIREQIKKDFPNVPNPTKNDIVRYKLYQELTFNGYKDLYTNTKIDYHKLFGKEYDIDHIIPQSRLFDDSFSNKVLVPYQANRDKGNKTAFDYMATKSPEDFEQYQATVETLFKENKISKAKYNKLLKKESKIGDGFIERDLRDSQYIAKKAKNMLYDITRSVVSTSGSITDRLREDWGLINIMKELNLPKYRARGLTEMEERKFGQQVEVIIDWTKRNDHRHHAMDALTVAFTKMVYINYLNYLNARYNETHKEHKNIKGIEDNYTHWEHDDKGHKKRLFNLPISNFRELAKEHLENVLVSHKAKNKVVTKNKNKIKSKTGEKVKTELTPRGQLHKETVYGKYHYYESKEEKVGTKFDEETINKVFNPHYRELLLARLKENGNDPKKAFGGKNALSKTPIYLNEEKTETLPEKVKLTWLVADYSIRKDVTPDNFKDIKTIEKVLDKKVKVILLNRLKEFGGEPKKAFSDLDKNPIWLNEEKCICIKRVAISGVKNAEPLHYQKDHKGNFILDEKGEKIPVDFVSTGNNHHVAIYRDAEGNLQDVVVTLMEAVLRVNNDLPTIFKEPKEIIDLVLNKGIQDELILNNLPDKDWEFLFTMKQNEMFVFPNEKTGFNPKEKDLLDPKNKKEISQNLFKVQTMSKVTYGNAVVRDYLFRHHLDASKASDLKKTLQGISYHQFKSLAPLNNIIKVRINHLGDIVSVGEY